MAVVEELMNCICRELHHDPTAEQLRAANTFAQFALDRQQSLMILRGAAGTGKTTLAAAIVRALCRLKQKTVLLAPTGRAAKVFSLYAGLPAYTIHRRIYRQKSSVDFAGFTLNDNLHTNTLFIVDEASMIANGSPGEGLLDDLMRYVYNPNGNRLLLIGDRAQLPPVGEEESPALMGGVMRTYGLQVYESDLNEVLRQSQESGILYNATMIRTMMGHGAENDSAECDMMHLPVIRFHGFPDIRVVTGDELIETLASSYSRVGYDETMVVTRSNKRANIYNQGIRRTILDREEELCRGDRLMIVKNNYFWLKTPEAMGLGAALHDTGIGFLANGDHAVVQRIRHQHELYGFRFADVTLTMPDYDDLELTATVMLDTLTTEAPALTREQQEQLYAKVMDDYADIPLRADRLKHLKDDAHYNALQVKFAYAVTCHKAQGGQWAHVYVDQGYMTDDMLTPEYLHWLYTAFTRATECLYLVNWPKTQTEEQPN